MDGFLAPGALAAATLAVPILIVYMLRTRRSRQVVPSTFLWREATKNVAASRPWDRVRPSVLLILQLLLLAALVIALARPYRSAPGVAGDHLVLVIDASGSMSATDEGPTRLDAAKIEAHRLIDTLSAGAITSVVAAGPRPRVVVSSTNDAEEAKRAVDSIEPTQASANFSETFLLAESLETPNAPATIAIVSDGGIEREQQRTIPPGAVFRQVGAGSENVGVTGLEVGEGPEGFRAFVQVTNHDDSARTLTLSARVDGAQIDATQLELDGHATAEHAFDLGLEAGRLETRIDVDDDLLVDNTAYAVLERTRPRKILLVTRGNLFLESLLAQLPGIDVDVEPEPSSGEGYDLAIYDRVDVPRKIGSPALFISPTRPPEGVRSLGIVAEPVIDFLAPGEPLLAQVDLSDLAIARAQSVRIPGARTLVGADDVPLLATWTDESARRAWIGFDLQESNLPLQVAFPILTDHLLSWLTGSEPPSARYAGDVIDLAPVPGATEIAVGIPAGRGTTIGPGEAFSDTERAGFYTLSFENGGEILDEKTLALSFPPGESDVAPRGLRIEPNSARPGLVSTARRSIAAWVLALALILLLIEWWWAHGRPLPTFPWAARGDSTA